jgi:hypothetical protein
MIKPRDIGFSFRQVGNELPTGLLKEGIDNALENRNEMSKALPL